MTREEAVKILKAMMLSFNSDWQIEALYMAIDALKVTPCNDKEYIANIDKEIKDKYVIYWTGYNLGFEDGKNGNEKRECINANFIIPTTELYKRKAEE